MSWWSNLWGNNIAGQIGINQLDELIMNLNREINGEPSFTKHISEQRKLEIVFESPAVLKVFALQCDLFSLGQVYVYEDEKEQKNDPFLELLKKPNPFQSGSQFLWDYMFWLMIGNDYCYVDSKFVDFNNVLYHLETPKITFPPEMDRMKDKLLMSQDSLQSLNITYTYSDGTTKEIPWSQIIHTPDLSNGTGNWFKGSSRLDALYKIVTNSESSLDAKNVNLNYSKKFMVAGQADPNNTTQMPMSEAEKKSIEDKMNGRRNVYAVKTMIDIKRFVSDMAALELDSSYFSDAYKVGNLFGIPRDVLELYLEGGSTYENQEKARAAHASYSLQPKGNNFFDSFANYFGYSGKKIIIDWEHLPFMQVNAKTRAEVDQIKSATLLNLMRAGVKLQEINKMLDLTLTELDYEKIAQQNKSDENGNQSNEKP